MLKAIWNSDIKIWGCVKCLYLLFLVIAPLYLITFSILYFNGYSSFSLACSGFLGFVVLWGIAYTILCERFFHLRSLDRNRMHTIDRSPRIAIITSDWEKEGF